MVFLKPFWGHFTDFGCLAFQTFDRAKIDSIFFFSFGSDSLFRGTCVLKTAGEGMSFVFPTVEKFVNQFYLRKWRAAAINYNHLFGILNYDFKVVLVRMNVSKLTALKKVPPNRKTS